MVGKLMFSKVSRSLFIAATIATGLVPFTLAGCVAGSGGGEPEEADPESGVAKAQAGAAARAESDFATAVPVRVESDAELRRMKDYVENRYDASAVRHSFRMPSGLHVDCVDIDKQPGLMRPEMRGQALASPPVVVKPAGAAGEPHVPRDVEAFLEVGRRNAEGVEMSCPEKTIPIRRVELETATQFRSVDDMMRKYPMDMGGDVQRDPSQGHLFIGQPAGSGIEAPRLGATGQHQYAHAAQSLANIGANVVLNVWSPFVDAPWEFSLSQTWVVAGGGSNLQTLEAGWQKYPPRHLFDDPGGPHLFIYSTSDNYTSQGCYDLDCGRFVQYDGSVVIGGSLTPFTSTPGGAQGELNVAFYLFAGNWWLNVNGIWTGYYPGSLFNSSGLANGATTIDFGGEIIDVRIWPYHTGHTATAMGSGAYPYSGQGYAAYDRNIYYYDPSGGAYYVSGLSASRDDPYCYDISLGAGASSFYFGGPGYNSNCQ